MHGQRSCEFKGADMIFTIKHFDTPVISPAPLFDHGNSLFSLSILRFIGKNPRLYLAFYQKIRLLIYCAALRKDITVC